MTITERREYYTKNKIKNEDIVPLIMAHVQNYNKINKRRKTKGYQRYADAQHPKISDELADVIVILTNKIVNGPKFKNYTQDWKEDFLSNAYLLICKYLHNFRPSANKNAIGYLYMSIENAIIQELNKHKDASRRMIECSIDELKESDLVVDEEFNVNMI